MEVGAAIWVKDIDLSWISATIISKESDHAGSQKIVVDTGESRIDFVFSDGTTDEFDSIKLQNSPSEAMVEDLINLPYLHEPAILHCLQNRYIGGNIYTNTGPILIALNPFKSVPLYTPQILESYYNFGLLKSQGIEGCRALPPHVYAVADAAYRDMMRVMSQSLTAKPQTAINQTILISGESGAGKTESTKVVLRYLTTVGNSSGSSLYVTGSVMDKVLQSNPILESFGNARTIRNDNSSRFGKFIELHFSKRGHLIGGTIRTYLLEKVRLVTQQRGERNFHIMYQLIAGCSIDERSAWQLGSAEDYWCCNQGGVYTLRSVDDKVEFATLQTALSTLNFNSTDQQHLFGAVAGMLHLSEVTFEECGDGCRVSSTESVSMHFAAFAQLCGLGEDQLKRVLTVRMMTAKDDSYEIELTSLQATEARDALSKALYSRIFEWIVSRINESIKVDEMSTVRAEIGVLDIFGFESFTTNSFEQLCINYTNETLQQQFNQFVFKLEQSEYQKEQISWSFIEFPDNQECLDLIEHKQNGILAVLDDVCKLGQATDEKFVNRLYKLLVTNPRFAASAAQKRSLMFCVTHYAGPVEYLASSFVEKNKNELPKEATNLFRNSTLPLIHHIFSDGWGSTGHNLSQGQGQGQGAAVAGQCAGAGAGGGAASAVKVLSVSMQFRSQLAELMVKVSSTMPHYIRCLKPNDQNQPDEFHRKRTTEQLRYGGVLEAVRVARSGFPVRLSQVDFFSRYRCLADNSKCAKLLPLAVSAADLSGRAPNTEKSIAEGWCKSLLVDIWDEKDSHDVSNTSRTGQVSSAHTSVALKTSGTSKGSIQCGMTKVFLRKTAHDILEGKRSRRLRSAACKIQSRYRGHYVRVWYLETLRAVCLVQRIYRGGAARRRAEALRWGRAAVRVQTQWRAHNAVKKFKGFLHALLVLQSNWRRRVAKARAVETSRLKAVVYVQRVVRGVIVRRRWKRVRQAVISLQCKMRQRSARNVLQSRRSAGKDLGKMQLSNDALKVEISLLRAKAQDESKRLQAAAEERSAAALLDELQQLRLELEASRQQLEQERAASQYLEDRLALSESDFMKATTQIIDLRSLIATTESDDEEEGWSQKSSSWQKCITECKEALEKPQQKKSKACLSSTDGRAVKDDDDIGGGAGAGPLQGPFATAEEIMSTKTAPSTKQSADLIEKQRLWSAQHTGIQRKGSRGFETGTGAGAGTVGHREKGLLTDMDICIAIFEKNLSGLRARLVKGMKVLLWEEGPGCHVHSFECIMTLDRAFEVLSFAGTSAARRSTFSMFSQRIEVDPIRIEDIADILSNTIATQEQHLGLLSVFKGGEKHPVDTLTITINQHTAAVPSLKRMVLLKAPLREDRNFLLSALRTLISVPQNRRAEDVSPASTKQGAIKATSLPSSLPAAPGKDHALIDHHTGLEHSMSGSEYRGADDTVQAKRHPEPEKKHYDKLLLQVFAHSHDLNEKDDMILKLKKQESLLETALAATERLQEQDAIVRLQLGKRLEQVLLDKEEAYEELHHFKEKLECIQSAMSVLDFSKSSSVSTSTSSLSPRNA